MVRKLGSLKMPAFGKDGELLCKAHLVQPSTAKRFYRHVRGADRRKKGVCVCGGGWSWAKRLKEGNLVVDKTGSGGGNFKLMQQISKVACNPEEANH